MKALITAQEYEICLRYILVHSFHVYAYLSLLVEL